MTKMDYKEKYECGLECIQEILSGAGNSIKTSILRKRLQPFFPELNEKSYSERIRKELIEHIKANKGSDFVLFKKFSPDDVIAWLDRQGKTLDPDKVIEWISNQACLGFIEDIEVEKFVDKFKKDFGL